MSAPVWILLIALPLGTQVRNMQGAQPGRDTFSLRIHVRIQQQLREHSCLVISIVCKSCDFMILSLDLEVPTSCIIACWAPVIGHSRVLHLLEGFFLSFVAWISTAKWSSSCTSMSQSVANLTTPESLPCCRLQKPPCANMTLPRGVTLLGSLRQQCTCMMGVGAMMLSWRTCLRAA